MSNLTQPVLVLNKMWIPINTIQSIRAFTILFANKATIVDPSDFSVYNWEKWVEKSINEEENVVRTGSCKLMVPEVIVLLKYDKVHRKSITATKRNIYVRDGYHCQYSDKKIKQSEANIDHITPVSRGGRSTWENMVVCSKVINEKKGNRTPQEAGLKLIKVPKKMEHNGLVINPKITMPESWKKFIKQKAT